MIETLEKQNGMSLDKKEGQLVTRYIKNWADSAKFEVFSSHLTLCGLTVNRSEMPNFSYTHPLACIIKNCNMRTLLIILIVLLSVTGFSQTDSDLQTTYLLTTNESTTLNSIFNKDRKDFDFNGKVIGFTVGTTGNLIENKRIFFEKYINPIVNGQDMNVCSLIVFSKEEKSNSGGFDAVVMSPAKIFTKEHRAKLITGLSEITKSLQERDKYELIENVDLNHDFLINSVSTFNGYFYKGSDETFHYFIAKWDLKKDKCFKLAKTDLIVNEPYIFGINELKVSMIQSDTEFGHNDKNKLYIEK